MTTRDEAYTTVNTQEDFEKWCNEGGWDGAKGFLNDTSVSFKELQGRPFLVVHNRVYIEDLND